MLSSSPIVFELRDEPADFVVGVLGEAGEGFHLALEEPLLVGAHVRPTRGFPAGRGVSFVSAGMTPSFFCRAKVSSRSLSQPPCELALVFGDPLLRRVVRRVRRAGGEVHVERLVGRERLAGR